MDGRPRLGQDARMPLLPRAFRRDACRIAERAEEVVALGRGNPQMLANAKELNNALRDFLTRWGSEPNVASEQATLGRFRAQQKAVGWRIEKLYLGTLLELLAARREWALGEVLADSAVSLAELMKEVPEPLREGLRQVYEEKMTRPYDASEDYREAIEDADEKEAVYRRLRKELEREWPERLDDPILHRLHAATTETLSSVADELLARDTALGSV